MHTSDVSRRRESFCHILTAWMLCQQALKTFHNFWTMVTFLIFAPNLSSKAFWLTVSSVQNKQNNKTAVLQETGIWECFWYMHGDLFSPFWSWGWGRCRSRWCLSCCTRPGWRRQWSPAWGRPSTTLITNNNVVGHFHPHLHGMASEAVTWVNVIHLAFTCKPGIASCRWWSRPLFLWPLLHIYCTYLLYTHLLCIFFYEHLSSTSSGQEPWAPQNGTYSASLCFRADPLCSSHMPLRMSDCCITEGREIDRVAKTPTQTLKTWAEMAAGLHGASRVKN